MATLHSSKVHLVNSRRDYDYLGTRGIVSEGRTLTGDINFSHEHVTVSQYKFWTICYGSLEAKVSDC